MSLVKYASIDVLDSYLAEPRSSRRLATFKKAHRHEFDYEVKPGMLYVRARMISSRCNDNFDAFPAEELKKGYQTFIGKPAFINHTNADHRRARGVIIDAALHEDTAPDGSPDVWVEGLHELDAQNFPKMAEAILKGRINRTSMGVDVGFSICSACNNKATNISEYCVHVPGQKGNRLYRTTASGHKEALLIYESCYKLSFFENSFLVEEPADPTAHVLVVDDSGLKDTKKASLVEAARDNDLISRLQIDHTPGSGRTPHNLYAYLPGSGGQHTYVGEMDVDPGGEVRWVNTHPDYRRKGVATHLFDHARSLGLNPYHSDTKTEDGKSWSRTTSMKVASVMNELEKEAAGPRYADPGQHPFFQKNPVHHENIVDHWNRATPEEKGQGMKWYEDAHHVAKAIANGDAAKGAGVLAAYSPQTTWPVNMHNASRAIREGKGIGGKGSGIMATENQAKAAERMINGGEHHEDVLKGHKVRAFAHLIEHGGDHNENEPHVVVDRHALSVAMGKRASEKDYGDFPKSQEHYYGHVVNQYHKAAQEISRTEGRKVHPHQVQAATWLVRQRENAEEDEANSSKDPLAKGRTKSRQNGSDAWDQHMKDNKIEVQGPGYHRGKLGYGESKVPPAVDTLRDDNCPVCGSDDSLDGDRCSECGYIQTPPQFQDPDVDSANLIRNQQNNAVDPSAPGGVPGSVPGDDLMLPDQLGDDGITPDQIIQEQQQVLESGMPITPDMLAPDGSIVESNGTGAPTDAEVNGEAETLNNNNAPGQSSVMPGDQQPVPKSDGLPGTPADGVPDLTCPGCGFNADAQQPQTTDDPTEAPSQGLLAGDLCPNCGKSLLLDPSEQEQVVQQVGTPKVKPAV